MSSLKERLLRHKHANVKSDAGGNKDLKLPSERDTHLAHRTDHAQAQDVLSGAPDLSSAWTMIGAELCHNERGSFLIRRKSLPLNGSHGIYHLDELRFHAAELSAFQANQATDGSLSDRTLLFLDTETTGLGIGAGNVPFMIGIGYYSEDTFEVEQMFIRNPAEELSMLHYLQAKLIDYTHLVTYNGRTFDWPLILNRFILNRQQIDYSELLHIDLLHPSRSLWKNTLPTCKLSQVEVDRLGVNRYDDVPGSLAPALYFQYLADGNEALLHGVFKHNEQDIVTLALLVTHFAKLLSGQLTMTLVPLEEQFRSALWLNKMHKVELADDILDNMWQELLYGSFSDEANAVWRTDLPLRLASWFKQKHAYQLAVALWHRWIETRKSGLPPIIQPYIELAMYYEHRERDIPRALGIVKEADHLLRRRRTLRRSTAADTTTETELSHRMDRLRTKSQKLGNARKQ